MIRGVIDTNVVVSGFLQARGKPAAILNAFLDDPSLVVLWDDRVLAEYEEVLARPKFKFTSAQIGAFIDFVRVTGEKAAPATYAGPMRDEDDRMFVEVAIGGRADVLVTGNRRDFPDVPPAGVRILSPTEFLVTLTVRSIVRAILPWLVWP